MDFLRSCFFLSQKLLQFFSSVYKFREIDWLSILIEFLNFIGVLDLIKFFDFIMDLGFVYLIVWISIFVSLNRIT